MKFSVAGRTHDIIKGSIATLVLFLAYVSLPLAGMVAGLFAPLPAAFYSLKNDNWTGAAIVAIAAVGLAVVADPASALLYLLGSAVVSLALPFFIERGVGGVRAIVSTAALNIVLVVAAVIAYGLIQGVDIHAMVQKGIDTSIAQTASLYEKGGVKGEELEAFQSAMRQAGSLIGRIYPAMLIIGFGCIAGATLGFLLRLSARLPRPIEVGDFKQFKNPEQLVWVVIVAGFALLIPNEIAAGTALNILIVTLTFYCLQGMAVIAFFFNRLATPTFLRVMFYIFLAVQPYLAVAVTALGIFDLWGNFRTPKKTGNL